jgi:hypothetical protein
MSLISAGSISLDSTFKGGGNFTLTGTVCFKEVSYGTSWLQYVPVNLSVLAQSYRVAAYGT